MADATDSKSVDRKVMWVRLPPSVPEPPPRYDRGAEVAKWQTHPT